MADPRSDNSHTATEQPETTTPFAAPQVTLPKGGGAIRGLGEKFQTNPANGTGTLSIPVQLSESRGGFQPALALTYSSGGANGPYGLDWTTGHPSISRRTDKGVPHFKPFARSAATIRVDDTGEDIFLLSGSEDLVPILEHDGPWIGHRVSNGYFIRGYRPRIEGAFVRIESWTRQSDGDTHWRTISRDNTLTVYGEGPESRIADPEDPQRVFTWLICRSYDDRGNAIEYEYAGENDEGVDTSKPNERFRSRAANRYLKRIYYGNREPQLVDPSSDSGRPCHVPKPKTGPSDWLFEVVFDYGDEYVEQLAQAEGFRTIRWNDAGPARPRPSRLDPFSTSRAGFEIRTYRLCQRILMTHRMPEALGQPRTLIRALHLHYEEKANGTRLARVTKCSYRHLGEGRYREKALPALLLHYSSSPLDDPAPRAWAMRDLPQDSLDNLPAGVMGEGYEWTDLDGEGIAGVLAMQAGAWFYKPNRGDGRFGPVQVVRDAPPLAGGRSQLMDVDADGQLEFTALAPGIGGFFDRASDAGWEPFRPFPSMPVVDFTDPNVRLADITGDGLADILITNDEAITWHPSLGDRGFGEAVRVRVPWNEDGGPRVLVGQADQSVFLADMSGDGLTDLVRIRNGEVCYWQNLGYGKFGPKITMDHSPWFDEEGIFDARRIRLADTDGSGPTDLIYAGRQGVKIFLNESGNSLSAPRHIAEVLLTDGVSLDVVDLLGRGTACLVWSTVLPGLAWRPVRYIDLMCGDKPHLLVAWENQLGAETRLTYASSTEFYLADRAAGRPWATRLPFPVHVVKTVESIDRVSNNRIVSSYCYHHGHYDGVEREFRGFGMVEQKGSEWIPALEGATNWEAVHRLPPVLMKTWFHTGHYDEARRVSRHFETEYYREGDQPILLPDTILPADLTPEEAREACRALKGSELRHEIYTLDDSPESGRPYSVSESNFTIRVLQPRGRNRYAIFHTFARESVTFHYDRKLYNIDGRFRPDPRVAHQMTLRVNEFGNVLDGVMIGYGRRYADASTHLTPADHAQQARILVTYSEGGYSNAVSLPDAFRTPLPVRAKTWELGNGIPASHRPHTTNLFSLDDMLKLVATSGEAGREVPFADWRGDTAPQSGPYRRLLDHQLIRYRSNRLDSLLPAGQLQSLALPGEHHNLAFPDGLIEPLFAHRTPEAIAALLESGGYVDLDGDGNLWRPSGRVFYTTEDVPTSVELDEAASNFFLVRRVRDPFGQEMLSFFDGYRLMIAAATDALGNRRTFDYDYRVLAPFRSTDVNGNRTELAFDTLGMVAGTAVMGKASEHRGDSLEGFVADLDDATIAAYFENPFANPALLLGRATTRNVYDLDAYSRHGGPSLAAALQRETHDADLGPEQSTRIQHGFTYSDGFGREVQKKVQAEPGEVEGLHVERRWVGTSWTIFNNKGLPVRQYEPFFSATHAFEFNARHGVSSILVYDAVARAVATLKPNGTYSKTVYEPWRQDTWDLNDTTLLHATTDPDIGSLVGHIADASAPSWYDQRIVGVLGADEQVAARRAAVHAGTPSRTYFDSIGRVYLTVAHNRVERNGTVTDEYLTSRVARDIENAPRLTEDALGRSVMRSDYDLLGATIYRKSADAGERWMLADVTGQPLIAFDGLGRRVRTTCDVLRRPVGVYVREADGTERLAERTVYGEEIPDALEHNLRGKPAQLFDGAGVVTNEAFDFKGNLLSTTRQLATAFRNEPDWQQPPSLEAEIYRSLTTYDALNRAQSLTMPDRSVIQTAYNEANLLDRVELSHKGSDLRETIVRNIEYNAKAQRERIGYGNGVSTEHEYDSVTFRLVRTRTTRHSDDFRLQDLAYTFDPVGNVTSIQDAAQATVFFNNQAVHASSQYEYDALYRLISATGREHAVFGDRLAAGEFDIPPMNSPLPSDGQALRRYREEFTFDAVGNLLELLHTAGADRWRRIHEYGTIAENNRLTGSRIGSVHEHFTYDAHGNTLSMPHLPQMAWNVKNQLQFARRQVVDGATGAATHYVYDAAGERVRKVVVSEAGKPLSERIYLGLFEVERETQSDAVVEREALHIMDGTGRVALVESRGSERTIRFQLSDHLGSASLELDEHAAILSREEYYAFGETSFRTEPFAQSIGRKRYRFTGQERDDDTGLSYHGARYYAPWLARWTAPDPSGMVDGPNLYQYARSNPIANSDPNGRDCNPEIATCVDPTVPDDSTNVSTMEDPSTAVCQAEEAPAVEADPNDPSQYDTFEEFSENAVGPLSDEGLEAMWGERDWDPADTEENSCSFEPEPEPEPEPAPDPAPDAEAPADDGSVGEPGLGESLIPIWGSGRESVNHFQHGRWVRGTFWGVMAVSDVFLVKSLIVGGGKLIFKGGASVVAHTTPNVAAHTAPEVLAHTAPEVIAHGAPGVTAHTAANVTAHATSTAVSTGGNVVYHSVVDGKTIYVGITNNVERRAAEHLAKKGIVIDAIPGLTNLTRADARAVEQVLIEFHGLGKNGGTLINKINSIAKTNPRYADALIRGRQLLQQVGYPGF
ncbi:MAG TPA: SpvB/TcaC N-terminal domain-containing protein [Vicinamibacterales bacterium]|nr:SpvB/TcaC N-terminal domain-containing protein [Vicinamibacterales bacterium]